MKVSIESSRNLVGKSGSRRKAPDILKLIIQEHERHAKRIMRLTLQLMEAMNGDVERL